MSAASTPPGGTNIDIHIDGTSVGSIVANTQGVGAAALTFGDGSSGSAGESNWDYLVVNTQIPEPSSIVLLGLGFVGLLRAKRRRA